MFIRQKEINMQIKIDQSDQLNEKLKKRNQALIEENAELRRLLESRGDEQNEKKEENNMEIKVQTSNNKEGNSIFKKYGGGPGRSSSQGYARVIRRSNEPVNIVVKTTKISYKRRNEGNI